MRVAGAAAREMLLLAAAKTWNVPVRDLRAEKGRIYHAPSKRKGNFSDFSANYESQTPQVIYTSLIADLETPVSAYLKLRKLNPCFLLESVEGGELQSEDALSLCH